MDLYNDSHEKVCILSGIKETCITSTLKTGDKEITFEFRKTNRYAADIKEEGYIRTDTDEFVIKQVEPSGEWYKCTGTLNWRANNIRRDSRLWKRRSMNV